MKNRYKPILPLLIVFIICSLNNCDLKRGSEGEFDHIIVFADSALYSRIQPMLEQTFDQFIYTPHTERSFLTAWRPFHLLNSYRKRRNIMFIGLFDQNDYVSEYVKKMLAPDVRESVENGNIFEIFKENMFANDQMGIVLSATNENLLRQNLTSYSERIFNKLEEYHFRRLNKIIYSESEQQDIENYLSKDYGWKIRVPYSYQIVTESSDQNFIWIKRVDPSRSIFIYRTKADSSIINEDWLTDLRNRLTTEYYEGDSISTEDTYAIHTKFKNYSALKLIGVWQNHKQILGGPFRTYAFNDPDSDYVYVIDLCVVAPGKRKKPYLDQLEVIARTFQFTSNKM